MAKARAGNFLRPANACERKVADGHDMGIAVACLCVASPIAKRVELFDIAQMRARLLADPFAQTDFKRAMGEGIERS